jgi:hypothetical protein
MALEASIAEHNFQYLFPLPKSHPPSLPVMSRLVSTELLIFEWLLMFRFVSFRSSASCIDRMLKQRTTNFNLPPAVLRQLCPERQIF